MFWRTAAEFEKGALRHPERSEGSVPPVFLRGTELILHFVQDDGLGNQKLMRTPPWADCAKKSSCPAWTW
jgi:hypothetical protein